jgi:hypothetical protein
MVTSWLDCEFESLELLWETGLQQDTRSKIKTFRCLRGGIKWYVKNKIKACSLEQLQVLLRMIVDIKQQINWFIAASLSNQVFKQILAQDNYVEPRTIRSMRGHIEVDSGVISLGDLAKIHVVYKDVVSAIKTERFGLPCKFNLLLIEAMLAQQAMYFEAGNDGRIACQIRLVEAPYPFVTAKELRFVRQSSEQVCLQFDKDVIDIMDLHDRDNDLGMTFPVDPGYYLVQVHHVIIPKKSDSFYLILCRCEASEKVDVSRITRFN